MKTALEQCGGTIKDGLCMKCFNRAISSSSICIQMYEVEIREPGNEAKKDEAPLKPKWIESLELKVRLSKSAGLKQVSLNYDEIDRLLKIANTTNHLK